MKTALVIPIYNRPQYVKQCFASLLKLTVKPDVIILVNDGSTDGDLLAFLQNIEHSDYGCEMLLLANESNKGVKDTLKYGIEYAFNKDADIVINVDSDAVVKPDFIDRLTSQFMASAANFIVSGFNCNNPTNPVTEQYSGKWDKKIFCNGINMCFNRSQYEKYIEPSLLKGGNWDYNTSLGCQGDKMPFIILSPSVVQHIGMVSSMGHNHAPIDRADDFKQLHLPDVTLFGIDAHDIAGINRAASISQRDIQFGETNIITERLFPGVTLEEGRRNYSRFMIKDLPNHFSTSHVLTIHADGYIVNWQAWDNSWLQYDYIGATWGYKDNMNVGNGGFSLRSKKLCDILASNDIPEEIMHPEDHCICRVFRESLERDFGIKFAPEEVANKFSIEAYGSSAFAGGNKYSGQFGFHSPHVDFAGSDIPQELWLQPPVPAKPQPAFKRVPTLVRR